MSRRLESGRVIGIEFVAKGQIWGMYIRAEGNQWKLVLCLLKPSQIDLLQRDVLGYLKISRDGRTKLFGRTSTTVASVNTQYMRTVNLPVEGNLPNSYTMTITSHKVNKCHQSINKDGSCYLILSLRS